MNSFGYLLLSVIELCAITALAIHAMKKEQSIFFMVIVFEPYLIMFRPHSNPSPKEARTFNKYKVLRAEYCILQPVFLHVFPGDPGHRSFGGLGSISRL